jgi:hypothetical protein
MDDLLTPLSARPPRGHRGFDLAQGDSDGVVDTLAKVGATIVTPVSHAPGAGRRSLQIPRATCCPST